jgi:hypothetical protein
MRSGSKAVLAIAALGVATLVGYFGYDSYAGKKLVRELCAKDGGLKIYETTYVPGFLDETVRTRDCTSCFERLAKRQFEYVDIHLPARTPQYYRYSLAPAGDARCDYWSKNVDLKRWAQYQRNVGISEAQCVAVEPLAQMPNEYVYARVTGEVPNARAHVLEMEYYSIRHSASGLVIAEYRNYWFYEKVGYLYAIDAGKPGAAATCASSKRRVDDISSLLDRALRDLAKATKQ